MKYCLWFKKYWLNRQRQQETLEYELTKSVGILSLRPPVDLEEEKYTIAVTKFEK